MKRTVDVVVVGGGIAGVSAAAALADSVSVLLVEKESALAYHTGRSAALYYPNYGVGPVRPLTLASRETIFAPPDGFTETPIATPRAVLTVATDTQVGRLRTLEREAREIGVPADIVDGRGALALCPILDTDVIVAGLLEPDCFDLDVSTLHQGFVRTLRRAGADIATSSPVVSITRHQRGWNLETPSGRVECGTIVNAAGAWGDEVARMAGLEPVGLRALRRTAFMVPAIAGAGEWPFVVGADHDFYFRPDGEQFLCSPSEEVPSEPADVKPRDEDIALAIERINAATTLGIRSVRSAWTGLRTFSPDRAMVIGPDPDDAGFVWLVGQGGTGIQTAPAAADLIADLVLGRGPSARLIHAGIDTAALSPQRFRR